MYEIPALKLVKILGLKVQSWHIFRKVRLERTYSILRDFLRFLRYRTKNRQVLIVDSKFLKVARLERALTQKIKRGLKGLGWGRRKRKLYSVHKQKEREIDEKVFGVLVMAIIDEKGQVVDVWFTAGRKHESKALREKLYHSGYVRKLFRNYEGLICESKELKGIRQRIEGCQSNR